MNRGESDGLASLIEAVTELVVKELCQAQGQAVPTTEYGSAPSGTATPPPAASPGKGARVLVIPGPEPIDEAMWGVIASSPLRPSALLWAGGQQEPLPAVAARFSQESRERGWSKIVGDYAGVILLGSDLGTLGSIASLGSGGLAPAVATVAAISSGLPVFCDSSAYERVRRHSARLAPGFVRAFEGSWQTAVSFGVEFGSSESELARFVTRFGQPTSAPSAGAGKSTGRDVVTTEDVEAARRSGLKELFVGHGAIVTPLARQQAVEWGIEVKFQ